MEKIEVLDVSVQLTAWQKMSERLMVTTPEARRVSHVVRLAYEIPAHESMDALCDHIIEKAPEPVAIPLLPEFVSIAPDMLVGIALYPGGKVHTIGTCEASTSDLVSLLVMSYWSLLDPDDKEMSFVPKVKICGNLLVALIATPAEE